MTEQDMIIQDLRREVKLLTEREPKWISVKDRQPKQCDDRSYVKCLVYLPYYDVIKVGEYSFCDNCWRCNGLKVTVTHWMPLPEPPKED